MNTKRIKLRQGIRVINQHFDAVNHRTFQNSRNRYWSIINDNGIDYVTPQGFCWLYCWACTGMNSNCARVDAERAFNTAFEFAFFQLNNAALHRIAERLRYIDIITDNDWDTLNQFLNLNN